MKVTKQITAGKLADYLHHIISLEELVDWAECAMMEGDFEEHTAPVVSAGLIARAGTSIRPPSCR